MTDPLIAAGTEEQAPTLGDAAADLIEFVAQALAAKRMSPRALDRVLMRAALHKPDTGVGYPLRRRKLTMTDPTTVTGAQVRTAYDALGLDPGQWDRTKVITVFFAPHEVHVTRYDGLNQNREDIRIDWGQP